MEEQDEIALYFINEKLEPEEKVMLFGRKLNCPDLPTLGFTSLSIVLLLGTFGALLLQSFTSYIFAASFVIALFSIHFRARNLPHYSYYALTNNRLLGIRGHSLDTLVSRKQVRKIRSTDDEAMIHFHDKRIRMRFFKGISKTEE